MSSHHIVREKQEPALLILNLSNFDPENLGQLLEWSPTVLVADHIIGDDKLAQLKIDIIISADPNYILPENTKIVHTDLTSKHAIFEYLIKEEYAAVNIIDDRFDSNDYLSIVPFINLVVYVENKKHYAVKSGFNKWKPAGEQVFFHDPNNDIVFTGLRRIDQNTLITEKDGFFSLQFESDFLFIAEQI